MKIQINPKVARFYIAVTLGSIILSLFGMSAIVLSLEVNIAIRMLVLVFGTVVLVAQAIFLSYMTDSLE